MLADRQNKMAIQQHILPTYTTLVTIRATYPDDL